MRRAGYIRRQRMMSATVAALTLVVGVAAGLAIGQRGTGPTISTVETAYQFDHVHGALSVGQPVPTTALANVTFANAEDGFAIAIHRAQMLLAATSNGGHTWSVVDPHLYIGFTTGGGSTPQFEFTSPKQGYMWGENVLINGEAPLLVTNDGGLTWRAAQIGGPVVQDVSAIGDNVWALVGGCPPISAATDTCPVDLDVSTDGGLTWSPATAPTSPPPPPAAITPSGATSSVTYESELARITLQQAYVLEQTTPATTMVLSFTGDGGASWSSLPVPCNAPYDLGAELAASSTDDLWLLCGSQGSAGSQPKELFRSDNGGQSWLLASQANGADTAAGATTDTGAAAGSSGAVNAAPAASSFLPLAGYIAPFTIGHKNLAVASATTAWLFPGSGGVYKTTDGGITWVEVPDLRHAEFDNGGAADVTFISITTGWVTEFGVGLWHTGNGNTWSVLGQ
jgi:hypothetical protein